MQKFFNDTQGGIKRAVWTMGFIVIIIAIILYLFIISPDLVYTVIMRLLDFVLINLGI